MTNRAEAEKLAMARSYADRRMGAGNEGHYMHDAIVQAYVAAIEECSEMHAHIAETLPIGGNGTLPIGGSGTLSSWVNANESPMNATRRHIATAIRNHLKGAPNDR